MTREAKPSTDNFLSRSMPVITDDVREWHNKKLAEIQANQDKLDRCTTHSFQWPPAGVVFGQKLYCTKCKGEMNAINAFHYAIGYEAAGGNPNYVIENFRDILPKS